MKSKIALLLVLIAIGFHIYLTLHYYELNFGLGSGESICNLNSKFNCDTVSASPFAALLGMPLALWGAATNGFLAIMILMSILGWVASSERHKRYTLWLSAVIASASIVMGFISTTQIGTYCLFCMGAYILSFLTLILLRLDMPKTTDSLPAAVKFLFSSDIKYVLFLLAVPVAVLFFHKSYVMNAGGAELDKILKSTISDWQAAPQTNMSVTAPSISKGPDQAKMVISEFADFRCSHCKQAVAGLKAFFGSRNDIKMQFYTFPLDGTCNEALGANGDGISCLLAKNVYCAEKVAQKGWLMHDHIFSIQEKVNTLSSLEAVKDMMNVAYSTFSISADEQLKCVDDPETDKAIRAQAKLGQTAGVQGTPTIFVNGKKLPRGQLLPVLDAAYNSL